MLYSPDLWKDISRADQYVLRGKTPEEKLKQRDVWLRSFLHTHYNIPRAKKTGAVFLRALVRDDYKTLFHKVIDASGIHDHIVVEDYLNRPHPAVFNADAARFMLKHQAIFHAIDVEDPLDRACCFIRACQYAYVLDQLSRIDFQALICFADMQPTEHVITRYFRAQGKTTITLQHGLYVDYGEMDTINVINYLHQPSEYFLSWGENTKTLIEKFHPDTKVVNCGKPLIFSADPPAGQPADDPYVAVFLDQQIFNEQNHQMVQAVIQYARKANLAVRVRFHPSINKKLFTDKYPEIREQLHFSDAAFVVGHTSSLIYEAIAMGSLALQFATDIPSIPLPETRRFKTVEQLEACLAMGQPKQLARHYFTATGDASLSRYTAFFRETLPHLTRSESAKAHA